MLVANYNIDKFVQNPPKEIVFFLIHGNDLGYIAKTKETLTKSLANNDISKYEVATIDAKEGELNQTIINQIITQGSLFGIGKIVQINNFQVAMNLAHSLLDNFTKLQTPNNFIIATANKYYSKNTNIIKKININNKTAAISCFSDQQESLAKLIKGKLSENNIRITNEAIAYLNEVGNQDRLENLAEIEKIILYANPNQLIEIQDVREITNKHSEAKLDNLFDALLDNNIEKVNLELENIANQDLSQTFIIRTLSYNILRLIEFKDLIKSKKTKAEAMEALKPAVFFLNKNQFIHNESKHSLKTLQIIFQRLLQAEIDVKTSKINKKLQISKMIADILLEFDKNPTN